MLMNSGLWQEVVDQVVIYYLNKISTYKASGGDFSFTTISNMLLLLLLLMCRRWASLLAVNVKNKIESEYIIIIIEILCVVV